jgi:hypothetical protein
MIRLHRAGSAMVAALPARNIFCSFPFSCWTSRGPCVIQGRTSFDRHTVSEGMRLQNGRNGPPCSQYVRAGANKCADSSHSLRTVNRKPV